MKDKIEKRLESNLQIIEILKNYFIQNPDLRFIQGLWALGFINRKDNLIEDKFYEESVDTLSKITQIHVE